MCQIIRCNPWSTRLHLHPIVIKKMRTYLELEGKLGPKSQPQQNQSRLAHPITNPLVRKETKVTDKRRNLIPTRRYKVQVVAKPESTPRPAMQPHKCLKLCPHVTKNSEKETLTKEAHQVATPAT